MLVTYGMKGCGAELFAYLLCLITWMGFLSATGDQMRAVCWQLGRKRRCLGQNSVVCFCTLKWKADRQKSEAFHGMGLKDNMLITVDQLAA